MYIHLKKKKKSSPCWSSHVSASCTHLLQHTLDCPLVAVLTSDSPFARRQTPGSHVSGDLRWHPGRLMLFFFPPSLPWCCAFRGVGGQSAFGRVLCQTSNEGGEGRVRMEGNPSPPRPLVSCLCVVSPRPIRHANKTNKWTKGCKVAVALPQALIGMRLSVSVRFAEVEPQTDTLPPPRCCCCCCVFFFFHSFFSSSPLVCSVIGC